MDVIIYSINLDPVNHYFFYKGISDFLHFFEASDFMV